MGMFYQIFKKKIRFFNCNSYNEPLFIFACICLDITMSDSEVSIQQAVINFLETHILFSDLQTYIHDCSYHLDHNQYRQQSRRKLLN